MIRYFAKRLGMMLVALFMIILLTFVIEHSIPGDLLPVTGRFPRRWKRR